ncbi:MAG: hypothetical protein RhofKO_25860 [Rhodothermales bacterium]
MPFFDPDSDTDLTLLHASVRAHAEVRGVAVAAEWDVIENFTEQGDAEDDLFSYEEDGEGYVVRLRGYHSDPAQALGYNTDRAAWSGLCRALRRTIADVTAHRLRFYHYEEGVTEEKVGQITQKRAEALDARWPEDWSAPLARYRVLDYLTVI